MERVKLGCHSNHENKIVVKMSRVADGGKSKSDQIVDHHNLSDEELDLLIKYFQQKCENGKLDEASFKDSVHQLLGINNEIMLERIFRAFDYEGNGHVSIDEWLTGISTILKGEINELIAYCFRVFDLKSDGYITKADIIYLLKDSLVQLEENEDPEEEIKNLAKITIKNMDLDRDGRLSFQDFSQAVTRDISLLEAFGNCLPHDDFDLISTINNCR